MDSPKKKNRQYSLKPLDIVTFLFLISLSVGLFLSSLSGGSGSKVLIETPTETLQYSLTRNKIIKVEGAIGTSVIEIQKGRVRMIESACDHKLCIKKGWTYRTGDSIVCLPNRVRVKVIGKQRKIDAITQ